MFIESVVDLANSLHMNPQDFNYLLYVVRTHENYNSFVIPKRNGSSRTIYAPNVKLKNLQKLLLRLLENRWLNIREQNNIKNKVIQGFQKGTSIFTNAYRHRNKRYVLNVDLKDFFDSIHFGRVFGFFLKNKYFQMEKEAARIVANLCCYRQKLPQGAPTSPILSNLIAQPMDYKIVLLCQKYHLIYSRYADDLTFSTNEKQFINKKDAFLLELSSLVRDCGFRINDAKTRLQEYVKKQKVTGLTVNKKVGVDRVFYKETRAMACSLYKGKDIMIDGEKGSLHQLEGRFSFIYSIDQENRKNAVTSGGSHNRYLLNSREKQYQLFLFYKTFIHPDKPSILTEGKTDVLYLKAALKSCYSLYPDLICKTATGFEYKIRFVKKSSILNCLFSINVDGAGGLSQVYQAYTNQNQYICYRKLKGFGVKTTHPFVLLFDNEKITKKKPLKAFLNTINLEKDKEAYDFFKMNNYISISKCANLYLLTTPLLDGKEESEIEDLLPESILSITLDGKKFNRKGGDEFFGKEVLSKYVYEHYQSVDFSRFRPLLDTINRIVKEFQPSEME